jgi:hypothetical protein
MSDRGLGQLPNILPFAPGSKEGYQRESDPREEAPLPADGLDNAGQTIMGLLQEAATAAKENCGRALGVAHSLSVRLRAAEDRIKELEAELQHFQDRALRAENWLSRISREIENRFFEQKDAARARPETRPAAPPPSPPTRRPG